MNDEIQGCPPTQDERDAPSRARGFAIVAPKKLARISSKGGVTAHAMGLAHEFTSATAREAARKRWLKVKPSED